MHLVRIDDLITVGADNIMEITNDLECGSSFGSNPITPHERRRRRTTPTSNSRRANSSSRGRLIVFA